MIKAKSSKIIEYEGDIPIVLNPSPLDFDDFVPWACKQWCGTKTVTINRKNQETHYAKFSDKKTRSKIKIPELDEKADIVSKQVMFSSKLLSITDEVVSITAFYDSKEQLIEISIIRSENRVTRQIIKAIGFAIPYHRGLIRFTFRRSRLTAELIYEIGKLLPISTITEICFDDSYVPQGNYYILLQQYSQLKYLSLNRCQINDATCKKIFDNINIDSPAANTLQILELGLNDITDDGAQFIGSVLRGNRCLRHLNLSGNKITDSGFIRMLESFKEFQLNPTEEMTMRRRKLRYILSKMAVYARCLKDLKSLHMDVGDKGSHNTFVRKFLLKPADIEEKSINVNVLEEEAMKMAREIVGEFYDPYSVTDVEIKNGLTYCKGNFVLCSLNMAFNELNYPSIQKLSEVVQYQHKVFKFGKDTGLIRVTLDGNYIPTTCTDLNNIDFCLKNILDVKTALSKRSKSITSRKRMV